MRNLLYAALCAASLFAPAITQAHAQGTVVYLTDLATSLKMQGNYSSGTTYNKNDVVVSNGSAYYALQGSTNQTPASGSSYWGVLAVPQSSGSNLSYQGTYSGSTTYASGAIVTSGGSSYVSLQASNTGNSPATSPSYWGLLAAGGSSSSPATSTTQGTVQLGSKATNSALANVASTGAYGDLTGAPSNVSSFTNDAGYQTSSQVSTAVGAEATARQAAIAALPVSCLSMDTTNVLAIYRFTETSGNLLDCSGNGRDATVTSAPTRDGVSYYFTNGSANVDFPNALNASNTYYFGVTLPTLANGGNNPYGNNNFSMLMTSTAAAGGTPMMVFAENPKAGALTGLVSGQTGMTSQFGYAAAGFNYNYSGDAVSGTHVIILSCPTGTQGVFYLDSPANPLPNYGGTNSCNGLGNPSSTTTNYRLGPATWNSAFAPLGLKYWAAAFSSAVDTPAQMANRANAIKNYMLSKGATFAGTKSPVLNTGNPVIYTMGDSIPCGYALNPAPQTNCINGAGSSPGAFPGLTPSYTTTAYTSKNVAVPGTFSAEQNFVAPYVVDPYTNSLQGQNIAALSVGTNDLTNTANYAAIFSRETQWAADRAANNLRPLLYGKTSRGGSGCAGSNCDSAVQSLNAIERAGWRLTKFVGYVDVGSDPLLGATGTAGNAANQMSGSTCLNNSAGFFYSDALHLCGAHTQIAKAGACVINGELDGTNAGNMGGAIITASTTFAQAGAAGGCADGGRYADPTNGAINLTLFSAVWQTGREIAYCNVSSSSSNALTLTAPSDFPFSNVSGRTTVTVAPNTCARFRATFNGNPAAPGNYWLQM